MSYYPNYYMNGYSFNPQYPFPQTTQLPPIPQTSYQMLQATSNSQQMQQPTQGLLNGKIVDSEDVVKATEVPIGGYGIFPKADLSEIYIKSWNNNGTTSVITFKPIIPEPSTVQQKNGNGELTNLLLQKMELLDNKLDMFLKPQMMIEQQPQQIQQSQQTQQTQMLQHQSPIQQQLDNAKKMEVVSKNGF